VAGVASTPTMPLSVCMGGGLTAGSMPTKAFWQGFAQR
jgi:hypothetical protein